MRNHIVIVAWLHIIIGSLTLLVGLALFLLCVVMGLFALPALPIIGGLGVFVLLLFAAFSLPNILMGWGLLNFQPWARIVGILLSIFGMVLHPMIGIGMLLGIYSLIILFHPETVALFEGRQQQTY